MSSAASRENSNCPGGGSAVSLRVLRCVEVAFSNEGAEGILSTGSGVTPTGSLRPFSRDPVDLASPYTCWKPNITCTFRELPCAFVFNTRWL